MQSGIVEIDLHQKNCEQAKMAIDAALKRSTSGTYRIRLIHGFHGGTAIRDMIREEYGYARCEQILRIVNGNNPGITELVLREF